jgi:hypothetical protein
VPPPAPEPTTMYSQSGTGAAAGEDIGVGSVGTLSIARYGLILRAEPEHL